MAITVIAAHLQKGEGVVEEDWIARSRRAMTRRKKMKKDIGGTQ